MDSFMFVRLGDRSPVSEPCIIWEFDVLKVTPMPSQSKP